MKIQRRSAVLFDLHRHPRLAGVFADRTAISAAEVCEFKFLTVLHDAGYDDEQALRWLLTEDDAIPGRPVDAMAEGRDTAVKRRAQVLAF